MLPKVNKLKKLNQAVKEALRDEMLDALRSQRQASRLARAAILKQQKETPSA